MSSPPAHAIPTMPTLKSAQKNAQNAPVTSKGLERLHSHPLRRHVQKQKKMERVDGLAGNRT